MNQTVELQRATITVGRILDPKPGQRQRKIKDLDGRMFDVWPEHQALFAEGRTYEIGFTEKRGDKATFRDIKAARELQQRSDAADNYPSRQAARRDAPPEAARAPMRQSGPPDASQHEPPRAPQNDKNNGFYRPTHPRDARRMFITATLGHFIETGRLDCTAQAIADAIVEIATAYDHVLAKDDAS